MINSKYKYFEFVNSVQKISLDSFRILTKYVYKSCIFDIYE